MNTSASIGAPKPIQGSPSVVRGGDKGNKIALSEMIVENLYLSKNEHGKVTSENKRSIPIANGYYDH